MTLTQGKQGMTTPDGGLECLRFDPDPDALIPINMDTVSEQTLIDLLCRYFYGAAAADAPIPSVLGFAVSHGIRLCDVRRMYLQSAAFAKALVECECIRREIIARRVLDGSLPVNQAKFLLDDDVVGYSERYLAGGAVTGDCGGNCKACDDTGFDGDCGEGFRLIVHFDDPALQCADKESEVRQ